MLPALKNTAIGLLVAATLKLCASSALAGDESRDACSAPGGQCPPAPGSSASSTENKEPFEFEYFEEMMNPVESREKERLCGLDKVCVTLWKKGKLKLFKEGRLFEADFDGDGVKDEAVILEQDVEDDPMAKEYLVYISNVRDGQRKILLHELVPEAQNIIDVFWDPVKKALVIDTGGRIVKTQTMESIGGSGYMYETGKVLKVVVVVKFNAQTNKFDIFVPSTSSKPVGKKQKKAQ